MKRLSKIVLVALVIAVSAGCEVITPGYATAAEAMAPWVAQYGAPTGKPPSIPVIVDHGISQVWTWYPVSGTKTLTVTASEWKADFATNMAWATSYTLE